MKTATRHWAEDGIRNRIKIIYAVGSVKSKLLDFENLIEEIQRYNNPPVPQELIDEIRKHQDGIKRLSPIIDPRLPSDIQSLMVIHQEYLLLNDKLKAFSDEDMKLLCYLVDDLQVESYEGGYESGMAGINHIK